LVIISIKIILWKIIHKFFLTVNFFHLSLQGNMQVEIFRRNSMVMKIHLNQSSNI